MVDRKEYSVSKTMQWLREVSLRNKPGEVGYFAEFRSDLVGHAAEIWCIVEFMPVLIIIGPPMMPWQPGDLFIVFVKPIGV